MTYLINGISDTQESIKYLSEVSERNMKNIQQLNERIAVLSGFCAGMAEDVEYIKMELLPREQGDIVMQDEQAVEEDPEEDLPPVDALALANAITNQFNASGVRLSRLQMEDSYIELTFHNRRDEMDGQKLIEDVMGLWTRFYNCNSLSLITRVVEDEEPEDCEDSGCPYCNAPTETIGFNLVPDEELPAVVSLAEFKAAFNR